MYFKGIQYISQNLNVCIVNIAKCHGLFSYIKFIKLYCVVWVCVYLCSPISFNVHLLTHFYVCFDEKKCKICKINISDLICVFLGNWSIFYVILFDHQVNLVNLTTKNCWFNNIFSWNQKYIFLLKCSTK